MFKHHTEILVALFGFWLLSLIGLLALHLRFCRYTAIISLVILLVFIAVMTVYMFRQYFNAKRKK